MENGARLNHRMLCVLAHPDDESFCRAGTFTKFVNQGVDVHLMTFTPGQAGMRAKGVNTDTKPSGCCGSHQAYPPVYGGRAATELFEDQSPGASGPRPIRYAQAS